MKTILIIFCFMTFGISAIAQDHLNIMTFNIRYNNPRDSLNGWPHRADKVSSQILFHESQGVAEEPTSTEVNIGSVAG